jgi:hypothetical protein
VNLIWKKPVMNNIADMMDRNIIKDIGGDRNG